MTNEDFWKTECFNCKNPDFIFFTPNKFLFPLFLYFNFLKPKLFSVLIFFGIIKLDDALLNSGKHQRIISLSLYSIQTLFEHLHSGWTFGEIKRHVLSSIIAQINFLRHSASYLFILHVICGWIIGWISKMCSMCSLEFVISFSPFIYLQIRYFWIIRNTWNGESIEINVRKNNFIFLWKKMDHKSNNRNKIVSHDGASNGGSIVNAIS